MIFETIGLTMLHSLWQGALLFLGIMGLFYFVKSPQKRVPVLLVGIFTLLFSSMITFSIVSEERNNYSFKIEGALTQGSEVLNSEPSNQVISTWRGVEKKEFKKSYKAIEIQRLLGFVWLPGSIMMLIFMVAGINKGYKIRKSSVSLPNEMIESLSEEISLTLGVKRVNIRFCKELLTPCVIGMFNLVIVLPASMASGIDSEVVKNILLHEYTHILKKDTIYHYLVTFIKSILFLNPFVWLLTSIYEREREFRCDSISCNITGNREEYAKTLYNFAKKRAYSPAISFGGKGHDLKSRVKRVLGIKEVFKPLNSLLNSILIVVFMVIGLVACTTGVKEGYTALKHSENLKQVRTESKSKIKFSIKTFNGQDIGFMGILYEEEYGYHNRYEQGTFNRTYNKIIEVNSSVTNIVILSSLWAPVIIEDLSLKSDIINEIDIVLRNNKSVSYKITNSSGESLEGVQVSYRINAGRFHVGVDGYWREMVSDSDGMVSFLTDKEFEMEAQFSLPGYITEVFTLNTSKERSITLKESKTERVRFVKDDEETPIKSAKVEVFNPRWSTFQIRETLKTDNSGYLDLGFNKGEDSLLVKVYMGAIRPVIISIKQGENIAKCITLKKQIIFKGSIGDLANVNFHIIPGGVDYNGQYSVQPKVLEEREDDSLLLEIDLTSKQDELSAYYWDPVCHGDLDVIDEGDKFIIDRIGLKNYQVKLIPPKDFPNIDGFIAVEYEEDNNHKLEYVRENFDGNGNSIGWPFSLNRVENATIYPRGIDGYYFDPVTITKDTPRVIEIDVIPAGIVNGKINYKAGGVPKKLGVELLSRGESQDPDKIPLSPYLVNSNYYRIPNLKPGKPYDIEVSYGYCKPVRIEVEVAHRNMVINRDIKLKKYKDLEIHFNRDISDFNASLLFKNKESSVPEFLEVDGSVITIYDFDPDYYSEIIINWFENGEERNIDLKEYNLKADGIEVTL